MSQKAEILNLGLPGFKFHDLYVPERLSELTRVFFEEVKSMAPETFQRFEEYRDTGGTGMSPAEISRRIIEVAPYLSDFVARLFGVEDESKLLRTAADRDRVIFGFKKEFFVRRALKKIGKERAQNLSLGLLNAQMRVLRDCLSVVPQPNPEMEVASFVMDLIEKEKSFRGNPGDGLRREFVVLRENLAKSRLFDETIPPAADDKSLNKMLSNVLAVVEQWLVAHYYGQTESMSNWMTFKLPHSLDYQNLVESQISHEPVPNVHVGPEEHYRRREGFDLTDPRYSRSEVMSEVDYCIFCHERGKDSCSKGMRGKGAFKKNPLDYPLAGCPLDQKISESHVLRNRGDVIGALAIIAIDNPLCPGTGHRICNDCMKACIYQKQEPVNIPQIETGTLTDVLKLPWGFEIYSLLTRWNPLNIDRPNALPYNGKNVLVVGMGPAGYTLAHYFLNEGFGVVGVDALKIEPLPDELVGSEGTPLEPLQDFASIYKKLSERALMGFGGVSEYGITARWDKNFLTVIYLNLLRRSHFRLYDGVRFGGTLTLEDVWDLGFDHACIAAGAGKPAFVSVRNNLIRGIRMASDFLMALQLTGAGKYNSMANLQARLPALVIGGGLTAIDSATELMAYYPVQVVKIKQRYEKLCAVFGKESIDGILSGEERLILKELLEHAGAIEGEQDRASKVGEKPNYIPLIRQWGGVHIYYRKSMLDSPAYRLNHEEIIKGFEEGIAFVENMSPVEAVPDEFGALKEMIFSRMAKTDGKWKNSGELYRIPARTLLVAAGTAPNVMYEREHPGTFELDESDEFFESYVVKGRSEGEFRLEKAQENEIGFFTSHDAGGRCVSYYGDNHPDFAGNVVKAMASAKHGFRKVMELLGPNLPRAASDDIQRWRILVGKLDHDLRPRVVRVDRLTPTIVEVILHAPQAARRFQPGQFYRLQNYEADSLKVKDTLLMMEGLALTGAWVDKEKGLISLIVLEFGSSTRMCSMLKSQQRVVVMGPTGAPTEIAENSTVLLLGGGLGNAVLFSIAKAFKEKNNKVIYFAGYKKMGDLFKREEIEVATDVVVYSVDEGKPIPTKRPQDKTFVGNIVQAMVAYAEGRLGEVVIPLCEAKRVIAIGSDRMMAAVAEARHGVLKPYLYESHVGIASINSPMQCMMKAVCAQCVQRHVVPGTREEVFVFTCFNQDQKMDEVDFTNLNSRLKVNSLMEKISNKWLDYVLERHVPPGG